MQSMLSALFGVEMDDLLMQSIKRLSLKMKQITKLHKDARANKAQADPVILKTLEKEIREEATEAFRGIYGYYNTETGSELSKE